MSYTLTASCGRLPGSPQTTEISINMNVPEYLKNNIDFEALSTRSRKRALKYCPRSEHAGFCAGLAWGSGGGGERNRVLAQPAEVEQGEEWPPTRCLRPILSVKQRRPMARDRPKEKGESGGSIFSES